MTLLWAAPLDLVRDLESEKIS